MAINSTTTANELLAEQIRREAKSNPNSKYAGKLVGIANGQVIVVADTWPEVTQGLKLAESDPNKCFCLEASADYERIEEIWRIH